MAYDAEKCGAFPVNPPAFTVPTGGAIRFTVDCSYCGGLVQNYMITLMGYPKRDVPKATLEVRDQMGTKVGLYGPKRTCEIGNVPDGAVYTVIVKSGSSKPETCVLGFSGAI